MSPAEIMDRFNRIRDMAAPPGGSVSHAPHDLVFVIEKCREAALTVDRVGRNSREKSVVMTHLEDAAMWAVRAANPVETVRAPETKR